MTTFYAVEVVGDAVNRERALAFVTVGDTTTRVRWVRTGPSAGYRCDVHGHFAEDDDACLHVDLADAAMVWQPEAEQQTTTYNPGAPMKHDLPAVSSEIPVPLTELVAEGIARDVGAVALMIDGEVVLDDIGRRCAPRAVARRLILEHTAKVAEDQERARQRQRELAEKTRAIRERNIRGGVPHDPAEHLGMHPVDAMRAADGEHAAQKRLSAADENMRDLWNGDMVIRPLKRENDE